ncbi:hypothetical protein EMIT0111MI5_10762 [Burkholderia sp. IT-111MI5]
MPGCQKSTTRLRDMRRNFVASQSLSLASILSEPSQAGRTVAGSYSDVWQEAGARRKTAASVR